MPNFVIGSVPAPNGFYTPVRKKDYAAGYDPLQQWLIKVATTESDPTMMRFAKEKGGLHYLDILMREDNAVICMMIDGELTVYSAGALQGTNSPPRRPIPRKMVRALANAGVNSETPVVYIRNAYNDRHEQDAGVTAGLVIPGLPPPSTTESVAVEIVDELLG